MASERATSPTAIVVCDIGTDRIVWYDPAPRVATARADVGATTTAR